MVLSFIKGIIEAQYICVNKLTMAHKEEKNEEDLTRRRGDAKTQRKREEF
jgi:hypothetical protein